MTKTFQPGRLSIGLAAPIEANGHQPIPLLERHIERAKHADKLGFSAIWLRDIPFKVPSFGDLGQIYDPFVYLGVLSTVTKEISYTVTEIVSATMIF